MIEESDVQKPEPNSFEDFSRRFEELQREGVAYGVRSIFIISHDDPFEDVLRVNYRQNMGRAYAVGCLETVKNRWINEAGEPDE